MCPAAIGDARRAAIGLSRSRQNLARSDNATRSQHLASEAVSSRPDSEVTKLRVQVWAPNHLVREVLCRGLRNRDDIDVVPAQAGDSFDAARLNRERHNLSGIRAPNDPIDVLVLISRGSIAADMEQIVYIRAQEPTLKILLLGSANEDAEFLQYVRAGISGYLWRDASAEDIAQGILNVNAGRAPCPGELCAALFRFFEDAEPRLPFGSPTQRLGLTRREQQIVPLIAKGLTNKEIANHFCLSEQTVKNHLYRMKHKIGAEDRLSIVQKFRHQGFLL